MIELYDYQQPHAEVLLKAVQAHRAAKDGSDCGTGKTPVAAWVATQVNPGTLVIVCPKIMLPSWDAWAGETGLEYQVINYEMLRRGNHPLIDRKSILVGKKKHEYFEWRLKPHDMIIWDEDHMVSGENTLNSRMARAATVQKIRQLYLGATSADGPHKMRALGFALKMHNGTNEGFENWAMDQGAFKNMFRKLVYKKSAASLNRIHTMIYGGNTPKGSRIRVADLGDRFPKNQMFTELYTVDAADQIQQCYVQLEEELNRLDEKEELDYDSALTLRLRARQRAELYKVPLLAELVEHHYAEGMSVPVFVSFRDSLSALSDQLEKRKIPHVHVMGGMGKGVQQAMLGQFQNNTVRVILLVDSAGGVGIDLHDTDGNYPRCTLVNPTDNAVVFKQVLGRAVRATGKSPVIQKIVCAKDTAEEDVYMNLRSKLQRIAVINDADISDADLDPIQRENKSSNFVGELS